MKNRFFFGFECKLLCFLLACATSVGCFAQSKIEGFVMEKEGQPLHGANVLLVCSDSLVAAVTTQTKGEFVLQPDTGKYTLVVSHMGYETNRQNVVLTVSGIKLSPIHLTKSVMELGGVEIAAEQDIYETNQNKTIFRVPSRVKNAAVDIYSVFTDVPSLDVDPIEKKVSLLGTQNSIVMVNNIRRDKGYLLSIKPENIDKIEIIRYPSMRYEVSGVDGIINIITKEPVTGYSGYLSLQQDPLLKYGTQGGGYTFIAPKLSLSLSAFNFYFDEDKDKHSIVRDITEGEHTIHTERRTNNRTYQKNAPSMFATLDYNHSKKSYSTLNISYTRSPQKISAPYDVLQTSGNSEEELSSTAFEKNKNMFQSGKANFYHQTTWNNVHVLSADIRYNIEDNNFKSWYSELNKLNETTLRNDQFNTNRTHLVDGQLNMEHKWNKITLEEGYRLYWVKTNFVDNLNGINSNSDYNEWRNNLYANALGSIGERFSYQLGLCLDIVRTGVNGIDNSYYKVIPSGMIRYRVNNQQSLTLDYKQSRYSPGFSMLNPTSFSVDSTRIIVGNPYLTPYYVNRFALGYELALNRLYISTLLHYRWSRNYITEFQQLNDDGQLVITYANAGSYSAGGLEMNLSVNVLKSWRVGIYGGANYMMYEDNKISQFNKNLWAPFVMFSSSFFYKKFSASMNIAPGFKLYTLTGYSKANSDSQLNCTYRLNNSWTLTGGIRYLLPINTNIETDVLGYRESYHRDFSDRFMRVLIGAQYNFSKGISQKYKQKKQAKRFEDSTEDPVLKY